LVEIKHTLYDFAVDWQELTKIKQELVEMKQKLNQNFNILKSRFIVTGLTSFTLQI
jgi:hypothetical protein